MHNGIDRSVAAAVATLRAERPHIRLIEDPSNSGCAGAWNRIIGADTTAPWWLIVNDDIAFPPGALRARLPACGRVRARVTVRARVRACHERVVRGFRRTEPPRDARVVARDGGHGGAPQVLVPGVTPTSEAWQDAV